MTDGYLARVVDGPSTGETIPIEAPVLVGREGDLRIADPTVSRRHARIEPTARAVAITDLGSAAGVLVDGSPASPAQELAAGAAVTLGDTTIRVLRLLRFSDAASGPAIRLRDRGRDRVVPLHDGLTIGRDDSCDVTIAETSVSRRHARIHLGHDEVVIEDLKSANGTQVNGRPIRDRSVLTDGAEITLGAAPNPIVYSAGATTRGPISVRAGIEGSDRRVSVTVDADPDATVAEVTRQLALALDGPDREVLLYRVDDGVMLHPDDRWASTAPQPGDELIVGIGDASSLPSSSTRRWPRRRTARLNQLPRTVWPEPAFHVQRIDPPESTSWKGRGILWQVMGGFGAVAVGLALVIINPAYWMFGMITGGIGLVTITASIFGEQSRRQHRVVEYRRKVATLDRQLAAALERQAASLRELRPTVAELEGWLARSSPRVWERRPSDPDALRPTLGTGSQLARIDVEQATRSDSPLVGELDAVVARHRMLEGVPVAGPGPDQGSLGITGDDDRCQELTARIIVESAMLHPPHQLSIWVAASDPSWDWCRWLPHVRPDTISSDPAGAARIVDRVASLLEDRRAAGMAGHDEPLLLVVIPQPSRRLGIATLPLDIRGRGLLVVTSGDPRDLPNGLSVLFELSRDGTGTIVGSYPDAPVGAVAAGTIDPTAGERLAVTLGRLDGDNRIAAPNGLLDLLGAGSAWSVDVAETWARGPLEPLQVPVGSDEAGDPVRLGFRSDGPHGMIAGTTGSGKSELLQTLLAGLALTHTPDRLAMFLIDFKGGATFAPFAELPHVVGLVTDLENDSSLARRAFTALDAEIERRKRVLDEARVANLVAYERLPPGDRDPLPTLLVVIDEFALLVERQPEVKDRLDTVATQGRSLGIHLLLATQSPSGVITHAIRTNTNLWICLRVVTDSESVEILGSKDAAQIPDGLPGRGLVRLGASDDLRSVQAARIARPVPEESAAVRVTRLDGTSPAPIATVSGTRETTELELVVGRIAEAARAGGHAAPAPLWMAPLPAVLSADSVPEVPRPTDRLTVLVGVADHPGRQAQEPHIVDLSRSGNAMFGGLYGYGKTTALLQVGADLARHHSPQDVHLYGLDAGTGSLGPLLDLPHTGDVVGANDIERLTRLIDKLGAELESRRERLAISGTSDFLRWRAQADPKAPWIVLLLDDYPSFREVAEQVEMGRPLERFHSLLQNGAAVGIHVVLSVSQGVDLRLREASLVPSRAFFRAAESSDYAMVDPTYRVADLPDLGPGRAIVEGGTEMQVCWPDPSSFAQIAAGWAVPSVEHRASRIRRLPTTVPAEDLRTDALGLALGLGGSDVETVTVDLDRGVPALLIAGPIGSGRSTALVALAQRLSATFGEEADPAARLVVVATRPGPLREWARSRPQVRLAATGDDVAAAIDPIVAAPLPGDLLVIDDAESLTTVLGVPDRLDALLRGAAEHRTRLLVGARVNDLPGLFDPWARYLMSLRRALLLQPTIDDAFLFGAKLPVIPPPQVPGRGVLIDGPRTTVLQLARPTIVEEATR